MLIIRDPSILIRKIPGPVPTRNESFEVNASKETGFLRLKANSLGFALDEEKENCKKNEGLLSQR